MNDPRILEVPLSPEELARIDAACRTLGVDRERFIRDAIAEQRERELAGLPASVLH